MSDVFGMNLVRIRKERGYTQQQVADYLNISVPSYRKYEKGTEPTVSTLRAIADLLNVDENALLTEGRQFLQLRFRALRRMNSRDLILSRVASWLDNWERFEGETSLPFCETEENRSDRMSFRELVDALNVNGYDFSDDSPDLEGARLIAEGVRRHWGIPDGGPITNLVGLLDSCGVKLWAVDIQTQDFFGLSVGPDDGGHAIVVNTNERISVERQLVTMAHELGHLLMHLRVEGQFDPNNEIEPKATVDPREREANTFASYLLMPKEAFKREWARTRGTHFVRRVMAVKKIFSVSYKMVLYRLSEIGYGTASELYPLFNRDFSRLYGRSLKGHYEPERLPPLDFSVTTYTRIIRDCFEQRKVPYDKLPDILGISREEASLLVNSWNNEEEDYLPF